MTQAEAALTKAQEQLDYMTLRSDFAGVITNWSAEVGQLVTSGQTVVTVARPDQRDAIFDVPDDLIAKVKRGASFTVSLQADLDVTTQGEVREIAPEADAATRTRRIKMTLTNAPDVFRLGTIVTITLKAATPPIITIPTSAILEKDGKASVWLVSQDGKAVPKEGGPRGALGRHRHRRRRRQGRPRDRRWRAFVVRRATRQAARAMT